jgi:hypothetical protein
MGEVARDACRETEWVVAPMLAGPSSHPLSHRALRADSSPIKGEQDVEV